MLWDDDIYMIWIYIYIYLRHSYMQIFIHNCLILMVSANDTIGIHDSN